MLRSITLYISSSTTDNKGILNGSSVDRLGIPSMLTQINQISKKKTKHINSKFIKVPSILTPLVPYCILHQVESIELLVCLKMWFPTLSWFISSYYGLSSLSPLKLSPYYGLSSLYTIKIGYNTVYPIFRATHLHVTPSATDPFSGHRTHCDAHKAITWAPRNQTPYLCQLVVKSSTHHFLWITAKLAREMHQLTSKVRV